MKTALAIAAVLLFYRWLRGHPSSDVSTATIARASARNRAERRAQEAHAPDEVRARIRERWATAEVGRDRRFRRSDRLWRINRRSA